MLKTKILVTYGPAISKKNVLKEVLKHSDAVRINFSHMQEDYWLDAIDSIRKTSSILNKEVALLADLPGPKIRIGNLDKPIEVKSGEMVRFSPEPRKDCIEIVYKPLLKEAKKGMVIDIGDGTARFKVKEVTDNELVCRAINYGVVSNRKGVSFLGATMKLEVPTKRDLELARFAKKNSFDFVGVSYVRSAKDIAKVKNVVGDIGVIAKIETRDAIRNLAGIADASDSVMVARGDLSMQVKLEYLPEVQRRIIATTRLQGKPVIVATQFLTSMLLNPAPTRAEANDISNAVLQGADCLMLSDETIIGKYPVNAVRFLAKSAAATERFAEQRAHPHSKIDSVGKAMAFVAADLADEYKTDCIFVPTQTGSTARTVSALRPCTEIMALVSDKRIRRSLSIYYGIRTHDIRRYYSMDEMVSNVNAIARQIKMKNYIVVSGSPNAPGTTDTVKYIQTSAPDGKQSRLG